MSFQDEDSLPQNLVYRITTLLRKDGGSVEHIDFPFIPVLQFTQEDVNRNRIIYRPPNKEIGSKAIEVYFKFIGKSLNFLFIYV